MFGICEPAFFYFVVSMLIFIVLIFEGIGSSSVYCLGIYPCDVKNYVLIKVIQLSYIFIGTFILNSICQFVHPLVSWIIIFVFFLFFVLFFSVKNGYIYNHGADNYFDKVNERMIYLDNIRFT